MLAWSGNMDALEEMLPRCDFLVIACPLTESTRNLIDARRLALLPPGAVIINVARGEIIDEAALFDDAEERQARRCGARCLVALSERGRSGSPALPLPVLTPCRTF